MKDLRALVVDDEPLARRRLRALVEEARGVTWVGEAATGARALESIRALRPDVVFLDVEMPGMTGLQVVERADPPIQVVFTTAYDAYAVKAFELQAADYLLKPFGARRLQAAVDRVRELARPDARTVRRIFVRERGRIVPVPVRSIERLEADGDYVRIHAGGRVHLVTGTLSDVHDRLDPEQFLRVHRSHVVNVAYVESYEPWESSRLRLHLRGGDTVVASRARSRELRARMT